MTLHGMAGAAPAGMVLSETQVERLKRRDNAAWKELFDKTYPLVYRAALVRTRIPAVAEDISGQVFLEATEGIDRYKDRGRPLAAWLLTITRHRCTDWFRKRGRETALDVDVPVDDHVFPYGDALELLDQLTGDQREVVHLRFVEGYSLEETASLTRHSISATKALQHRALARLRRSMTNGGSR